MKEIRGFPYGARGRRKAISDARIEMGAAFEAGIKETFPNAEITFDKFYVIKLANEAVDQMWREEARDNFQIKGRRDIFLENVDRLTQKEKEAAAHVHIEGWRVRVVSSDRRGSSADFRQRNFRLPAVPRIYADGRVENADRCGNAGRDLFDRPNTLDSEWLVTVTCAWTFRGGSHDPRLGCGFG